MDRKALLQQVQCGQRLRAALDRNEEVIVEGAGNHVAADVCLPQRTGEGCGQADRVEIRMNPQGDPCRAKQHGQPGGDGLLFRQDQRDSFALGNRRHGLEPGGVAAGRNDAVGVGAGMKHGFHRMDQGGKVRDGRRHDARFVDEAA
ncbi:hypothetical protein SDC9_126129 [bioreactor metagenome]|uniref:Uncharacterized protein n=1 Tax=bioreactor metagenome TaxID=1076179 RepID=A0A645CQB7_9ZZZZ